MYFRSAAQPVNRRFILVSDVSFSMFKAQFFSKLVSGCGPGQPSHHLCILRGRQTFPEHLFLRTLQLPSHDNTCFFTVVRELLVLWRKERVATRRCVECHGQPLCEAGNSKLLETHIVSLASRHISSRGLSEVNAFQRRHDGLTFPSQEMLVFLCLKFR